MIETNSNSIALNDVETNLKKEMKKLGVKQTTVAKANVYLKPLEKEAYVVLVNKDGTEQMVRLDV